MKLTLETNLEELSGIGPARAKLLHKLGLHTAADLLAYFPREYEDRSVQPSIAPLPEQSPVCFIAMVTEPFRVSRLRAGMELCKGRIADDSAQVEVTFFNQSYVAKNLQVGESYVFFGKLMGKALRRQMTNPLFEKEGQGRLTGGIMPIYPLTAGISQTLLSKLSAQVIESAAQLAELLPAGILAQYQLAQTEYAHRNIHFPENWEALALARRRLIFEELLCLSLGLALLRERRREGGAQALAQVDTERFFDALPFAPTGAQRRALSEIAVDLQSEEPMNRLLQGDVGAGKTLVAAGAMVLAAQNGLQSALMAPTELLARQHECTLSKLLAPLGLRVGLLIGAMTPKQKKLQREAAALGEIDVLVGTQALLSEGLHFRALGLVVTDEQHRFGVAQRASLAQKAGEGKRAHVLVMSATPIPRTLALMVYGDLALSILDELPPGRQPVQTLLIGESKRARLWGFVRSQVQEGRQVYLVCPLVEEGEGEQMQARKSAEVWGAQLAEKVFPDLRVAILHGKQSSKDKERIMADFAAGGVDILVSTTVIEVGVDVANASLMIIENAECFGLSQLHQLRGRVGRGAAESFCVLLTDARNEISLQRLEVLRRSSDGFFIAEEDLRLRGPGDFFGRRQHGLPALKLADLAGDMRVLQKAQEACAAILEVDPQLKAPEHRPLRAAIRRLFAENEGA